MPIIRTTAPLKERAYADFYPTDVKDARAGLSLLPDDFEPGYILDPGAGTGVWGIAARERWPNAVIVGTDIRPLSRPKVYDFWFTGGYDYLLNRERGIFDLVMGNPPFGKSGSKKDRKTAEKFVRRSLALLADDGYTDFLLPLTFMAGQGRAHGLYRDFPPIEVDVLSERPSFSGDGKTDNTEYAIYLWGQGYQGLTQLDWIFSSQFDGQPQQLSFADALLT